MVPRWRSRRFHGTGPYDIATGKAIKKPAKAPSYTSVFGEALLNEARADERIVAITAAMESGTGLTDFEKEFPDRFIDVGICEENAAGMAADSPSAGASRCSPCTLRSCSAPSTSSS